MHIPSAMTTFRPSHASVNAQQTYNNQNAMTMFRPGHAFANTYQNFTNSNAVTTFCPSYASNNAQQNLANPSTMTTFRPSHLTSNMQDNPVTPNAVSTFRPSHALGHNHESLVVPSYTPTTQNDKPLFRFGYTLANAPYNLNVSNVRSLSDNGQLIEADKASGYTKTTKPPSTNLHYLTPNETTTNQMLDNFATFLHAELKVFAQILPSGKQTELEECIITATKTINSLKFSPNDPIGNLTNMDLQLSKLVHLKKPGASKPAKTVDKAKATKTISLFGGKVIKKIVSRADAKKAEARRVRAILKQSVLNAKTSPTLSKTPAKLLNSNVVNQPLIVRCHLPEKQISTFINHLRQELQTSPDLALNETSMELIEEEIDVVEHIKQETDVNPIQTKS